MRAEGEQLENRAEPRRSKRLAGARLRQVENTRQGDAGGSTGTAQNESRRGNRCREEMETDDDKYECDGMDGGIGMEVEEESSDDEEFDVDKRKSAVYKHLVSSPECRKVFDDSWFSVIRCARFFKQMQVLEAVYIRTRDPVLCKQKENVVSLTLFK